MYNFKKLKELRRKATTDEKMNGSFVRDVGVQPKDPQTAIQELSKYKLARYQMKAADDLRLKGVDQGAAIAQAVAKGGDIKKNDPDIDKRSRKMNKRVAGIGRAANKLTQKTNEEKQKPFRSLIGPEGPGMKRLRAKQDAIPMTDKSGRISRSRMQKKFGRFINTEETLDELEQKTLRSYINKARKDFKTRKKLDKLGYYSKDPEHVASSPDVIKNRSLGIKKARGKLKESEQIDELEQKTYMSYLSKSRGRVKSKPSVAKSRGHAIKKTPKVHKRLFGDEQYEKQMKKMSEMQYREEKKKVRGVQKAINRINEDGHADVASALRKCKTIMEDASDIHTKLAMMGTMDSLPSWWTNKLAVAAAYMDSMRDYLLYPTNEEVKDQKYLKKLKQTKDQATLGDMSTGMQKGGFQGRGMYEAKKVEVMEKVAKDKLIGKKDPFEPEPNITTQVIRTDSPDNVVK